MTALICAVQEGHWQVAECLIGSGASIDQTDGHGKTALMAAAAEGHLGVMELLLSKGADVKRQDRDGLTALGWACLKGHRHAVVTLLDKDPDLVSAVDRNGRTPLDLAATSCDAKIVQILLDRGAVLEHVDLHGMRPLDRAISCRNTPVVQAFLRRGAKLGPATWALAAGKNDVVLVLLGKLLDDGNTLYKKQRLQESAQRFQYALKKFPPLDQPEQDYQSAFRQLHIHLSLNLARCKRKLGVI